MLDYIISQTSAFTDSMPKSKRKKIGQFFTSKETADYMASMFDLSVLPRSISVLDPGTGTGILTAALMERLQRENAVDSVCLTCYETNEEVLPVLKNNLEYIRENVSFRFQYEVFETDYILSQADAFNENLFALQEQKKYDLIIGNPPYLRVLRNHPAALAMPGVVHGAPNLYFLFAAMSLFNLKDDCEMVYIIPRSWTSGAYFKSFRSYLLTYGKLEQVHLFISRDKVFSQEQVLQETIILKVKKTDNEPDAVLLTSTVSNNDFQSLSCLSLPYDSVVSGNDFYVFLPTDQEELDVIRHINRYKKTFPDIGLKMKTGIIVDFRQYEDLREEAGKDTVPLFYSQHIKDGRVNHSPSGKKFDWVTDSKPGLIQKNSNYLFCKRFTAKEERRRLQCGIYLSSDFPDYKEIGTQNKINFVEHSDGQGMTVQETYGVYALLNSTMFDMYYRILNGSTQVNSTEINSIPVPDLDTIRKIGEELIQTGDLSTNVCDRIINEVAYG